MDSLVSFIVRLMAYIARFARWIPGIKYRSWSPEEPTSILLVGYNGARNTGADVRVAALIDQIRNQADVGQCELSITTLDEDSMKPYLDDNITVIEHSTLFFLPLLKACSQSHVIVLCEGSMLKSKFANGLAFFLCEAAGIAKAQNKPCIAYGVEAGDMDPVVKKTALALCSDTFFIARTTKSQELISSMGFTCVLGDDTAWTFASQAPEVMRQTPTPEAAVSHNAPFAPEAVPRDTTKLSQANKDALDFLREAGWDGASQLIGLAAINPFCWPVKPSLAKTVKSALTSTWKHHYQAWYFFSWSKQREEQFELYLDNIARAVNDFTRNSKAFVVIIGMEALDAAATRALRSRLEKPSALVLSKEHDGYFIDSVISRLSLLVTSRYHAALLACKNLVPSIAVSMDERLENLHFDAGFDRSLLCSVDDPSLDKGIARAIAHLHEHECEVIAQIQRFRERGIAHCGEMAALFSAFLNERLPKESR